jgi:uncharacterized membrane protein YhiD involved in acid resistance
MGLVQDLQSLTAVHLTGAAIVRGLTVALVCGLLVSWFYRWANRRLSQTETFAQALVALTLITALVIMVIENNLARAFGLVGTMSIIRFRTAVKDVFDIVFIFFSLSVGLAAGGGFPIAAATGALFIGVVLVVLSRSGRWMGARREYLLRFSYTPTGDTTPYIAIFERYCQRHHLVSMRAGGPGSALELGFYVVFRDEPRREPMVAALRQLPGVTGIQLLHDDEYP